MQEKHLYEYAVIRLVPCVEREEFINAGIILYCQSQQFLKTIFEIDQAKAGTFFPSMDITEIAERLQTFVKICEGRKHGGVIGQLPLSSRFRWLTATRSTVIQTSKVHPGLCNNAEETLNRLFQKMVR